MKKLYLIALLFASQTILAQTKIIDTNQVRAQVNANGILFSETAVNRAAYEVPNMNGMGADVIYSSMLWFGGLDQNAQLHMGSSGFYSTVAPGPIASNYTSQSYIDRYNYVYSVSKSEIQTHQQNWNDPNYIIPNDILNWPGNGDVSNGEAMILASFVDYNGNNIYEPSLGDHPVIRGDKATFFILNDLAELRDSTAALALGMEFHVMVYQFATAGFLDSTTFINVKVINRSQDIYNQFICANYTDFDIGGAGDDYVGCSSEKNMMFAYNGDLIDDGSFGGASLFGVNPPACGFKLLNHNMAVAGYFNNAGGIQGDPQSDAGMWGFMNAQWGTSGMPFTTGGNGLGGTVPTNFIFDGNPNDTSLWTEVTEGNAPGDRRAFMASEPIDNFAPGDYICYDIAVLYSRTGGNAFLNVNGLFDVTDSAQAFYDTQSYFYCEPLLLGVSSESIGILEFDIFPNPSESEFSVSGLEGDFSVEIHNLTGKLVASYLEISSNQSIPTPMQAGIYLISVKQDEFMESKKLVVR